MKKIIVVIAVTLTLIGCKDRVIWDDNGAAERSTQDRKIWDSDGKLGDGERKIWNKSDGEPVVE